MVVFAGNKKTLVENINSSDKKAFTQQESKRVRELAYQFFINRDREKGHDKEDWLRAEEIVRREKK